MEGREEGERSQRSQGSRLGTGLRVPQGGAGEGWVPVECASNLDAQVCKKLPTQPLIPSGSPRDKARVRVVFSCTEFYWLPRFLKLHPQSQNQTKRNKTEQKATSGKSTADAMRVQIPKLPGSLQLEGCDSHSQETDAEPARWPPGSEA